MLQLVLLATCVVSLSVPAVNTITVLALLSLQPAPNRTTIADIAILSMTFYSRHRILEVNGEEWVFCNG